MGACSEAASIDSNRTPGSDSLPSPGQISASGPKSDGLNPEAFSTIEDSQGGQFVYLQSPYAEPIYELLRESGADSVKTPAGDTEFVRVDTIRCMKKKARLVHCLLSVRSANSLIHSVESRLAGRFRGNRKLRQLATTYSREAPRILDCDPLTSDARQSSAQTEQGCRVRRVISGIVEHSTLANEILSAANDAQINSLKQTLGIDSPAASRVIEYRNESDDSEPFDSLREVITIEGISAKTLAQLQGGLSDPDKSWNELRDQPCERSCGSSTTCHFGVCAPSAEIAKVIVTTNRARAQKQNCGKYGEQKPSQSVTFNTDLYRAALAHARDMKRNDFFEHEGSDGSDAGRRAQRVGYSGWVLAENIYEGPRSPEGVVDAWLESDGHCRGLMIGADEVGIATLPTGREGNNLWVQVFGLSSDYGNED